MDSDEEDIQLEATLVSALTVNQRRKKRKMWVRPIFSKRKQQGQLTSGNEALRFCFSLQIFTNVKRKI